MTLFMVLLEAPIFGQHEAGNLPHPCGLYKAGRALFTTHPHLRQEAAAAEIQLEAETQNASREGSREDVLIIPMVFHIIHFNGPENISNAQIHDAVEVLNTNMRALNENIDQVIPEFVDLVADIEIEFRLA